MIRTTRPYGNDLYYVRRQSGGYSTCIQGKPTDPYCDTLANCVGYANGAFNEECGYGYEKYHLNCNAENFIERAIASGLSVVNKPVVGSIMCWYGAGELAGHVAIVTEVINDNCVRTAESGYGSSVPFYTTTRYNNNGRWGFSANYPFRGFIINPKYPTNPVNQEAPRTAGPSDKFNIGDKVILTGDLYTSSNASTASGHVYNLSTTITRKNPGSAHPYNTSGDLGWCDESSLTKIIEETPIEQPVKPVLQIGSRVIITDTGNGSSYGDSNTAYGIGWERRVLNIWEGRPYPYQIGDDTGTTGFYKESSLKVI